MKDRARLIGRVLTVVHANEGGGIGGMETLCVDVSRELVRRGVQVTALIGEESWVDPLDSRFREAGVRTLRLDTDPFKGRLDVVRGRLAQARRLAKLWWWLRRWRPDVVHLHVPIAPAGLSVLALARAAGVAVVVTEHNVPWPDPSPRTILAARAVNQVAQAVISVSRYNARLRTERIGDRPDRHLAILNGAPIVETAPDVRAANRAAVRAQFGIGDDELVVGCLVRLVEGKGLHDLLRAFATVRRERPVRLLLVGDGALRTDLEALAQELDIADATHFAGHQHEPLPFLDAMDVFVLAVPAGSMSIALLEAMARGLASIITFCGPEEAVIHEETGLCAPPRDPAGLAEAIARLVNDTPLRFRLAEAGACHVRRHFSIERLVDDYLAVYRGAPSGRLPARMRADGPANPRPGGDGPDDGRQTGGPSSGCPGC